MIGKTIAGRYRIAQHLGTGGMADVWRAEDEVLGRSVAVKILHPHYASEENFVARFRQEAQAAANLSHPNIVNVYDWGREEGTYFIVMEFLPGETLKEILETRGNLRQDKAVEVARGVASALAYAHRNGVLHRDIKPHNIMLGPDGSVKVTDFGIARTGSSQLTQTGKVMGTAQYISPEQAQGRDTGPGTDIYSLGIVLYEMLTGNLPFEGESAVSVALKHVSEQPMPPRTLNANISPELERVVMKAMAKQPELRYRSADEMVADLDAIAGGRSPRTASGDITEVLPAAGAATTTVGGPPAATAAPPARSHSGRKRAPWFWIAVVVALVIAAGLLGWALLGSVLPKAVSVPDVTGRTITIANQLLTSKKLRLEIAARENSDKVPSGQIASQTPVPGATAHEGDAVKVTVSLGPPTVAVPSLIGLNVAGAAQQLNNAGLHMGSVSSEPSDVFDQGTVMSQIPTAGVSAARGSSVRITVSKGKQTVKVPEVKGMTKDKAVTKLADSGLRTAINPVFSDQPTDTVVAQHPDSGSDVTSGTVITLDVSKGPKLVAVPDVTGEDSATAQAQLEAKGFRVRQDVSHIADPTQFGRVQTTDPLPNTKVREGSDVRIFIGAP